MAPLGAVARPHDIVAITASLVVELQAVEECHDD